MSRPKRKRPDEIYKETNQTQAPKPTPKKEGLKVEDSTVFLNNKQLPWLRKELFHIFPSLSF